MFPTTPNIPLVMPFSGFKIGSNIGTTLSNNSSNSVSNNVSDEQALDILNQVFSMDAKNVSERNQLQKDWFNDVMAYNSAEAQKNRDFQAEENRISRMLTTELSNTAYSRAIEDLKRNGINPYFAISKGLTASSPTFSGSSGSAASVSSPSPIAQSDVIGGFTSVFNNLVNNAFANKKLTVDSVVSLTDSFLSFLKPISTKK